MVENYSLQLNNFVIEEFACPCCGQVHMDNDFLERLDRAREFAGLPFVVTSGWRCTSRNRAVGGAPSSAHLSGHAADIACNDSRRRLVIFDALREAGLHRIGLAGGFIHADNHPDLPSEVLWFY